MRVQRLSGPGRFSSPGEVVASLGAMQAQEFAEAKWSIAERMEGEPTDREVEEAFARGEILRVHAMRPTWHFVAPADLRWIQALTSARVAQANSYWNERLGVDEVMLRRGSEVIAEALSDGEPKLRGELGAALGGAGIHVEGPALGYVTHHAELAAVICSGPRRGKQQTYMLVDDRVPQGPALTRDDALAELARRYFHGHGPATVADFSWWSGLTTADCRAAIGLAGDALHPSEDEHGTPWYAGTKPARTPKRTGAHLIPMYDELGVAFKNLRMVYAEQPPPGVMARPVLIDGVTVGTWKRTLTAGSVTVEAKLFRALTGDEREMLGQAVGRFGRFLELPATLESEVVSG